MPEQRAKTRGAEMKKFLISHSEVPKSVLQRRPHFLALIRATAKLIGLSIVFSGCAHAHVKSGELSGQIREYSLPSSPKKVCLVALYERGVITWKGKTIDYYFLRLKQPINLLSPPGFDAYPGVTLFNIHTISLRDSLHVPAEMIGKPITVTGRLFSPPEVYTKGPPVSTSNVMIDVNHVYWRNLPPRNKGCLDLTRGVLTQDGGAAG